MSRDGGLFRSVPGNAVLHSYSSYKKKTHYDRWKGSSTGKWVKSFTLAKTTQNPIKSQLGFLENQDRGSRIEDKGSGVKNLI